MVGRRCVSCFGRAGRIDRMNANLYFIYFNRCYDFSRKWSTQISRCVFTQNTFCGHQRSAGWCHFSSHRLHYYYCLKDRKLGRIPYVSVALTRSASTGKPSVAFSNAPHSIETRSDAISSVRFEHLIQRHRAPNCHEAIVFQFGSRLFIINACIEWN